MLQGWRIVKARLAAIAFTGEGPRLAGGRWNSRGTRVVYLGSSASLALLEVLVHLEWEDVLSAYCLFSVSFDESLLSTVEVEGLPSGWASGAPLVETRLIGDQWVRDGRSTLLEVPSAIVPHETNYLLNPEHPDFAKITIGPPVPFPIDERLLKG